MAKRAGIYCRISQDRTGAGLGVERQEKDCRALVKRHGWTVTDTFVDNDVSAYSGKPRAGYAQLVHAITEGRIDVVVCWHEDRLHRSPRELEDYIDACKPRSVATHFAQAGELDLTTSSGRMMARIRGAVARQESEHKSERIVRAHAQGATQGRWRGGAYPYGWNVKEDGTATLNRSQAKIIRDVCTRLLAGESFGSLVKDLNGRGLTTQRGNAWNYTSLRQVLTRPKNAGLSELNGEIVGQMTGWPAIVTEDTWRAVCAWFDHPDMAKRSSNRAKWLLSGIVRCGGCGGVMRAAHVRARVAGGTAERIVYRCTPNPEYKHAARAVSDVDEVVEGVIVAALDRPDWRQGLMDRRVDGPDTDVLRSEAVTLRARLTEAAETFADGKITAAQLAKITERVNGRLTEVETAMSDAARIGVLGEFVKGPSAAEVWSRLDIDRKRSVIRELVDVTLQPTGKGHRFTPELVHITWKGKSD